VTHGWSKRTWVTPHERSPGRPKMARAPSGGRCRRHLGGDVTAALEVNDLVAGYEPGLPIVRGASLQVAAGEIVAIIGPNGAGKSTLVKAAAGLVPVTAGRVLLHGTDITAVPAHRLVHQGLAFVPQTENVFANLSIAENLELAAALLLRGRAQRLERLQPVYDVFPDLARQRTLLAGRLSGGQRQMLAVARALIARPRVLMLDEPSAGLSPKLVAQVLDMLQRVRDGGVTVLLVEQNVKAALAVADRVAVLVEGKQRIVAPAAELQRDPRIAELYLGRHAAAPAAIAEPDRCCRS
jgi:branched-chain amino acid transport system ATP-binding protein